MWCNGFFFLLRYYKKNKKIHTPMGSDLYLWKMKSLDNWFANVLYMLIYYTDRAGNAACWICLRLGLPVHVRTTRPNRETRSHSRPTTAVEHGDNLHCHFSLSTLTLWAHRCCYCSKYRLIFSPRPLHWFFHTHKNCKFRNWKPFQSITVTE